VQELQQDTLNSILSAKYDKKHKPTFKQLSFQYSPNTIDII